MHGNAAFEQGRFIEVLHRPRTHLFALSLTLEQRAVGGDFDGAACGVDQEFFNHSPAGLQFLHAGGRTSQFPLPCF